MNKFYERLLPYIERNNAYQTALALFSWDAETLAPPAAADYTAKTIGILSGEAYDLLVCDEARDLLKKLSSPTEQLSLTPAQCANVRLLQKEYKKLSCIPRKEYREFTELCATAQTFYCRAKQNNKFDAFAPVLEKIVAYTRRFASYRKKEQTTLYDVLLEDYTEDFSTAVLDDFFFGLQSTLLPLLKKITKQEPPVPEPDSIPTYPVEIQSGFCRFLSGYLGFDFNRGVISESEHPFTTALHNRDVRITNHYYEDALEPALFSILHETGHALYEMGVDDALTGTPAGSCISMGMHESQSRFYENMIGRSRAFWEPLFPKLKETFPQELAFLSLDTFIKRINKAVPSPIRTEADELTYPLHILIRYELEKEIIAGSCDIKKLPLLWEKKYKDYLGVTPKNAAEGILQDIHWAMGEFGYFPSYAIGSAIAAQIYAYMETKLPLTTYLQKGNLIPIRDFLRDHIHKYGAVFSANELLQKMTGEKFNPEYYLRYLTDKYTRLYHL